MAKLTAVLVPVLAFLGASVVAPSGPASAADLPPPNSLVVKKLSANGSGCRHDSASVAASLDNTAFTVTYSDFTAVAGPGVKKQDHARDCTLKIKLDIPKSYTYTLTSVDVRGYVSVQPGATASHTVAYSFPSSKSDPVGQSFTGPVDDFWQGSRTAPVDFAPCGGSRNLTVDNTLAVEPGTSDPESVSLVTLDSTDVATGLTYRLAWKAC